MIVMQKYERGDTVRITITFRDNDDQLIDPSSPTYDVRKPDGTIYIAPTALSKMGVGIYQADIDTSLDADLGYWRIRAWGIYNTHRILEAEKFELVDVK
jgi:uncharacterized protein YfaS (alpha-2-macroglobulin family)